MSAIPDKLAAGLVSLAAFIPSLFTNDFTMPYLGVGVSTVAGAALGTYAAIGYDDVVRPRGKLFVLASSTVILAAAVAGVLPAWAGWKWFNGGVEGGAAALCALVIYYALPEAIPTVRRLIRDFRLSDLNFFRRGPAAQSPPPPAPPSDGDPDK